MVEFLSQKYIIYCFYLSVASALIFVLRSIGTFVATYITKAKVKELMFLSYVKGGALKYNYRGTVYSISVGILIPLNDGKAMLFVDSNNSEFDSNLDESLKFSNKSPREKVFILFFGLLLILVFSIIFINLLGDNKSFYEHLSETFNLFLGSLSYLFFFSSADVFAHKWNSYFSNENVAFGILSFSLLSYTILKFIDNILYITKIKRKDVNKNTLTSCLIIIIYYSFILLAAFKFILLLGIYEGLIGSAILIVSTNIFAYFLFFSTYFVLKFTQKMEMKYVNETK